MRVNHLGCLPHKLARGQPAGDEGADEKERTLDLALVADDQSKRWRLSSVISRAVDKVAMAVALLILGDQGRPRSCIYLTFPVFFYRANSAATRYGK